MTSHYLTLDFFPFSLNLRNAPPLPLLFNETESGIWGRYLEIFKHFLNDYELGTGY